jgi:hypothetical protein
MKAREETAMLNRIRRRLGSARASVMLEFALVAPLVAATALFAADFTRMLRTEQQLEVASRLAADVEAHMADYYGKGATPSTAAKNVGKYYLVDVAKVADGVGSVYMKGECRRINTPITYAAGKIADFFNGQAFSDSNIFWNIVGKIFGKLMNFLTFRTINYITDIPPHDREVKISTAVYIPTIMPAALYSSFGLADRRSDRIGVAQFAYDVEGGTATTAWNMKLNKSKRHRVYCYMPVMDSVPVAPQTYVRSFKSWCAKQPFLKGLVN